MVVKCLCTVHKDFLMHHNFCRKDDGSLCDFSFMLWQHAITYKNIMTPEIYIIFVNFIFTNFHNWNYLMKCTMRHHLQLIVKIMSLICRQRLWNFDFFTRNLGQILSCPYLASLVFFFLWWCETLNLFYMLYFSYFFPFIQKKVRIFENYLIMLW